MESEVKVAFDFDRVLFKTDAFKDRVMEETGLIHTDEEPYENGLYSYRKHARLSNVNPEEVLKVVRDLSKDYLYEDIGMVSELDSKIIVTRGMEEYQRTKLQYSGALEYFDDYFIVQNSSKDVANACFLVDDKDYEHEKADIPGFLMDRSNHTLKDAIRQAKKRISEN